MSLPPRVRWRLKRFQLAQAFGFADRGWFIPYRYKSGAQSPTTPYPEDAFEAARPAMRAMLGAVARYRERLQAFEGRPTPPSPRFEQDWFPGLDAALLYAIVRDRKPGRIVEIGSGHSTRFAAQAIKDEGLNSRIVAIDPAPRAAIEALAPAVEIRRRTIQEAGLADIEALRAGDVLFIDSSHILMPGSDVDILFNRALPGLSAGVLVHIHDIFLPDPYPADWEWRGYNEQNAIPGLIEGGGYELLAASRYMLTRMADDVAAQLGGPPPAPPGARPASLWLEKRSAFKPI